MTDNPNLIKLGDQTFKEITEKDVRADVNWIYKQMGLGKPKIYIAESYHTKQQQILKYAKSERVDKLYNVNIRNKGIEKGFTQEKVERLRRQFGETTENEKLDKVYGVLISNTPNSDTDQFFGAGVEMFYSIDEATEKRISKFYRKGVFSISFFENECFICCFPVAVRFDDENRLSGGEKPAIEFADGNNLYFARNVFFTEDIWTRLHNREMSLTEILNLPNVEQRSVAIEFIGPEALLECDNTELISGPTERGNTLYEVELKMGDANRWNNGGNYKYKLLRYGCPSTDRQYASFIPEDIEDADEAMAWKHRLTREEYLNDIVKET